MMTMTVFGQAYPVIQWLEGDRWALVAHENGPAIACSFGNPEAGLLASPAGTHEDISEKIQIAAVEALIDAAWPLLKRVYYPGPAHPGL